MVTKKDYTRQAVDAAYSVLIELSHLLGEYRDHIVIIGGWVPLLIIPQEKQKHIGSMDVDIAINHQKITEAGYRTILELLETKGYRQGKQPFIFLRDVILDGKNYAIEVDLMAGEEAGTGKSHRHQRILDVHARKGKGIDLVFENPVDARIRGQLPNGGIDTVNVQVSSISSFIVMKSMALNDRLKTKDAWDIFYCLRNCSGGIDEIADELASFSATPQVKEAMKILAEKFSSPDDIGPTFVVNFEDISDIDERERVKRDAYERVSFVLARFYKLAGKKIN